MNNAYRWTYEEALAQPHNVLAGAYERAQNTADLLNQDVSRLNARVVELLKEVEKLKADARSKA